MPSHDLAIGHVLAMRVCGSFPCGNNVLNCNVTAICPGSFHASYAVYMRYIGSFDKTLSIYFRAGHEELIMSHNHHRGEIKHNAVAALVRSPLFRSRREQSKKGKGSYKRSTTRQQHRDQRKTLF